MPSRTPTTAAAPKARPVRLESETITDGVRVHVTPAFVPEESDAHQRRFIFSYKIRITNEGALPVKLVTRRWLIIDAHGREEVVEGQGVVGKQPRIGPGESFEYSSFCPLTTPWGTMEGWYEMARDDGQTLVVQVGRFYLAAPPKAPPARTVAHA